MEVLIVDDVASNLKLLRAILESGGHHVREATDGIEALTVLEKQHADVVISDILMPNMDGYRLCYEIRHDSRFARTPFIAYTATYTSDADRQLSIDMGADLYLRKPASADDILQGVCDVTCCRESSRPNPPRPDILRDYCERLTTKVIETQSLLASKEKIAELNEQLENSNRKLREFDRFKSEFLSTASHEMRTPLAIIREFASIMADEVAGAVNEDQQNCLSSILRNCDRLTSLIDDLLDLARIESGKFNLRRSRVEVGPLLEECFSDFLPRFKAKCQDISLYVEPDIPDVLGDRSAIQQVLVNLIGNAHKFIREAGSVTVRAGHDGTDVRFEVTDNGPGIQDSELDSIFDAFTQIERADGPGIRGTGLGLAISRRIVELHDGAMGVSSAKGQGTTFCFRLPPYSVSQEHEVFPIDLARVARKGNSITVALVAPRFVSGRPTESEMLALKERCDECLGEAKACNSVSDDGCFLYVFDSGCQVRKDAIEKCLESVCLAGGDWVVERETFNPNEPNRSLRRLQERIKSILAPKTALSDRRTRRHTGSGRTR